MCSSHTTGAGEGTAVRTNWIERETMTRPDWDIEFTHIGGRGAHDYTAKIDGSVRTQAVRAAGQVMVATSPRIGNEASPDLRLWATVARRLSQRGSLPPIPASVDLPSTDNLTSDQLVAAIAGPIGDPIELDPHLELDSPVEYEFWKLMGKLAPSLQRWSIPQASLDTLAGTDDERWVDFLVSLPWSPSAKVIELDDSDKGAAQSAVMAARDLALESAGIPVERVQNMDAIDSTSDIHRRLEKAQGVAPAPVSDELIHAIHGPPLFWRFLFALAEGVELGFLPTDGTPWIIDVEDQVGIIDQIMPSILDVAASLADIWNVDVVPETVIVDHTVYRRDDAGRYHPIEAASTQPQMHISFEPFRSPVETLTPRKIPSIVFRNLLLPTDLAWSWHTFTERPTTSHSDRQQRALAILLEDIFAHDVFRGSQQAAITRLLGGQDELVLLPTGEGKTLIYQMAGLLIPGTTLIVAPLRALIDDQERRLLELGIDRVAAIHAGKKMETTDRQNLREIVAANEALFLLVAPERLQIESFREDLEAAAHNALINVAVIDEVHSLSEWGHQFRISYLKLGQNIRKFAATDHHESGDEPHETRTSRNPPITALTATAGPRVLDDIVRDLDVDHTEVGALFRPDSFARDELNYSIVHTTPAERPDAVVEALEYVADQFDIEVSDLGKLQDEDTFSGIVFVPHVNGKAGIYRYRNVVSKELGIPLEDVAIYSGKQPEGITKSMITAAGAADYDEYKVIQAIAFRTNEKPVMVATSAFGMGIDKANIRYTIHVTMPSSLEAFAQETGRAGRDRRLAYNVLITALPPEAEAELLLRQERDLRKQAYLAKSDSVRDNNHKTDIDFRLFFHHSAFPDLDAELQTTMDLYDELVGSHVPANTPIVVRRSVRGSDEQSRERALYRLNLLGIVDDYTIRFRAGEFAVAINDHDQESVDEHTRSFVTRTTRVTSDAVSSTAERHGDLRTHVEDRLGTLLDYSASVEVGRIEALYAMYDLARSGLDNAAVHARLDAYLGSGPVAELLERLVVTNGLDLEQATDEMVQALNKTTPISSEEWAGAATRFVESYPDHPLVLTVLALGEAWRGGDSFRRFNELMPRVIEQFRKAGLSESDLGNLLTWMIGLLRRIDGFGDRGTWTVAIWIAIQQTGFDMTDLEDLVLDGTPVGQGPPPSPMERQAVLTNRILRHAPSIHELARKADLDDNHNT